MIQKKWHLWGFIFLVLFSVLLRYPFWGVLGYGEQQVFGGATLNYASSWANEGFFYLKGILYNQAASVEFLDPASRVAFYNPFAFFVVPIFLISKLSGTVPNIWMLNIFSLLLHVVFAFGIAQISYVLMSDFKEKYRRLAFLSAAACTLYFHKLFSFFTITYWSDLLVISLIVFILYLEQLIPLEKKKSKLAVFQQVLILFACLSDAYGIVFSIVLLLYYCFKKDWMRSIGICLPILFSFSILVFYVSNFGPWDATRDLVFAEYGIRFPDYSYLVEVFSKIFIKDLGFFALVFLSSFGVAVYLQSKKIFSYKTLYLFFVPPLFYTLFFIKGAASEFSVVKFYLPCAIFFCGLLPALFWSYADSLKKKNTKKSLLKILGCLPFVLALFFLFFKYGDFLKLNDQEEAIAQKLDWLMGINQPKQVIFSNSFSINYYPPQAVYFLQKPVWMFIDTKSLKLWSGIFRDATDYPLLWLDKKSGNSEECSRLYGQYGASRVSSYKGIQAYLFSSVKKFVSIPVEEMNKCIKAD